MITFFKKYLIEKIYNNIIGYHVAPSKLDDKIPQEGIKKNQRYIFKYGKKTTEPIKIYFWLEKQYAEWFKELHEEDGKDMTIWVVDLSGYNLITDEETQNMAEWSTKFKEGEYGTGVYVEENISPDRIIKSIS